MKEKRFVLDSYAILALVGDEPGAQTVADIMTSEDAAVFLSVINLGEVYYILLRRKGEQIADEVVRHVMLEESVILTDASWSRVAAAAGIKAKGGLSYADAFVLGLAGEMDASVATGDPEIRTVGAMLGIDVIWLG